eukprot:TRINITY_DN3840_c0_g1_i6.p1 TRINITY_DN3840_c0_g1~~TRINITY_DN3840_c0_g1_i6.p1  ORF type:complete len:189 (+),score=29.72 TRINITY_DN3840_c0_g1_i6:193-759(+)
MKVKSEFLLRFHLDRRHYLLTGRSVQLLKLFFDILDIRRLQALDDVQFFAFMQHATDLDQEQIDRVFDMFDVDSSGLIEFDEFYLLCCMLIAIKDRVEKQFLWRHSRTCFELLDEDGSQAISIEEFDTFGYLFNISKRASKKIFKEFDVDHSEELDYEEFRMFTLACIDKQQQMDLMEKQRQLNCSLI